MKKSVWIGIFATLAVFVLGSLTLIVIDRNTRERDDSPRYADSNLMVAPVETMSPPSLPNTRYASPPPAIITQPNAMPGGGIGVSAAPGVAFSYSYAFRLPNANIAGVQEQHAAACEKLGLDRCRITGMRYTVATNDDVRAMLSFKLAPDLARQFGKEGIAAIQKAQGSLVDAAIAGNDVGTGIDQSRRRTTALEASIRRLEAQQKSVGAEERSAIQSQIDSLRVEIERESQNRVDAGEALANTPMVFQYNSGNALSTSALGEAWATSTGSFVAIIGLFVIALGILAPWLLLVGGAWLLFRRFWKPGAAPAPAPEITP